MQVLEALARAGLCSVEGWILVEADNADACYEHAAEWAECLDWEVTPVLSDEQAGPLIAKAYS